MALPGREKKGNTNNRYINTVKNNIKELGLKVEDEDLERGNPLWLHQKETS